jgi:hypothetical protein
LTHVYIGKNKKNWIFISSFIALVVISSVPKKEKEEHAENETLYRIELLKSEQYVVTGGTCYNLVMRMTA